MKAWCCVDGRCAGVGGAGVQGCIGSACGVRGQRGAAASFGRTNFHCCFVNTSYSFFRDTLYGGIMSLPLIIKYQQSVSTRVVPVVVGAVVVRSFHSMTSNGMRKEPPVTRLFRQYKTMNEARLQKSAIDSNSSYN